MLDLVSLFKCREDSLELRIQRMRGNLSALVRTDFESMRGRVGWMVTLTYRPDVEWSAEHVKASMQRFRDWARVRAPGTRYLWVAELQKRGAVHYHLNRLGFSRHL